ncbi:hypothetical protein DN069_35825 [Streptacidiphilus pinicola]|uniref:Uncharacterized protein n=1 Tax=Streptacidiphilus pinicola TaxID=2219663 RepID=A0A2X0I8Q8_9ACTN|nr:hypothetical protein [Streptacidiphilus pinicola]RAG80877.1 hypothetical protein DN069_35825 [Streptacidiphilus pinicola]
MTGPDPTPHGTPSGWSLVTGPGVDDVLLDMLKSGEAGETLCRSVLRFLRALTLEAGAAVTAGREPPGVRLSDGRLSLVIPREPVLVSYVVLPDHRELRLSDVVWMA